MPTYSLRPLQPSDDAWLPAFWAEQWGAEFNVVNGEIIYSNGLPGFVAEQDGQRVGLVTYRLKGEECEVLSLDSLHPDQGIGWALLSAVLEAARLSGCRRVHLTTTNDNLRALRFYQRHGFRLVALRPGEIDHSRLLKPSIPLAGIDGIPLRDELDLEIDLTYPPGPFS